jgi:hypothetical protein
LKSHTESGVIVVPSVAINAGSFKDNADLFRNITGNVLESLRRFYLAYNTPTFIFRYLEQSPLRKFFNINSLTRIPPLTRRYVNRWQSQLDGSSKTGGIQIAGYGMEVGNDKRSLAELSEQDLFNMLGQIIAEFNKTFETKRIIFLIENLEECKDEELRHFLHTCRFLLERNNCLHFITHSRRNQAGILISSLSLSMTLPKPSTRDSLFFPVTLISLVRCLLRYTTCYLRRPMGV